MAVEGGTGAAEGLVLPREETADRYYDRLRAVIDSWLARHTGPRYEAYRQVLFLVPDVFVLVLRLAGDRRVSFVDRLKLWGLAIYILSPVDINLDFILPLGPLDDLALALIVLDSVLAQTPDHILQDHWPGDAKVIHGLRGLTRALRAVKDLGRSRAARTRTAGGRT